MKLTTTGPRSNTGAIPFPSDGRHSAALLETEIDASVEHAVRAMLAEAPETENTCISVTAHGGVVTLEGTVSDGRWLARFKNQVTASIPSAIIDDRLEWVLPDCGIGYA